MSRNPEYDEARRAALAAQKRKPARDPQTSLSRPPAGPPPTRRTVCTCGENGPGPVRAACRCAGGSLAGGDPEEYEAEARRRFAQRMGAPDVR